MDVSLVMRMVRAVIQEGDKISIRSNFRIPTGLQLVLSLFALAAIMNSAACAKGPSLVKEILVSEIDSGGMTPHTIVQTADGGLLIAGDANQDALAIKTNIQGKVLWHHVVLLGDREKLSIGTTATYSGSTLMTDGSTYLCGSMPSLPGHYGYGLLSHISNSGNILNEQFVGPSNIGPNVSVTLSGCERWGAGVVVLGKVFDVVRVASGDEPPQAGYYYWVGTFSSNGTKIWERLIPTNLENIDRLSPILVLPDQSLVFSGTRTGKNSEIFHLDTHGNVLDKSTAFRQIIIIKNINTNSSIRFISAAIDRKWSLVSIGNDFREREHVSLNAGDDEFYNYRSFVLPNNSLLIFGASTHRIGQAYSSAMLWFDPTLRSKREIDLNIGPYRDQAHIEAAARLSDGEFVVGRHLNGDVKGEGLALDFISTP